jgi:hypothetical protein
VQIKRGKEKMKTKLHSATTILTIFLIISILLMPVISIISIKPAFAADVTLPFTDGFETGDFSKWNGGSGGSVTNGSAYDGTYKAVFSSSYRQAFFTSTPAADCFMRAYVWISTAPSSGYSTSIFGLYQGGGYYMAEAGITNAGGTLEWILRYFDSGNSHTVVSTMCEPILGKWYCIEVEGKPNSATNAEARIYVDGNELTDVTKTRLNNTQQINCGYIWISNPASGATVWYDDVVIATSYIAPEEAGQTYTLSVSTVGSGSVTIDKLPPYNYGEVVQLIAVPSFGWGLSSWSGDLTGSTNPATILMDGNKTVTATFTPNTYNLTVSKVGSGSVTLNNSGPYNYGDIVKLTAVPDSDWFFQGWGGDLSGNTNPTTILIDNNKTVTATFNRTRIFEDGFETGDFSKWTVQSGGFVTSEDAYDGTYKAVLNVSGQYEQARFTGVDDCFMRAYIMFKSFPASGTDTTIFGVYNLNGNYTAEARVANVSGTAQWELRYFDAGVSHTALSVQQMPVLDTWYCVEVEGRANSATNAESRIYINGHELADVTQTGKNNNNPINCGYIWVSGGHVGTIWYDDVVIATAYISPEPIHDIAVTNVASPKKVIFQSFSGNVTTTIANNGNYSENVNVTVTAINSTGTPFTIGSFTNVPLNSGTSADLTLTWNTTAFSKGNYTLYASADQVPGENNTADNNYTGGLVILSIAGDLTGGTLHPFDFVPDGKVDGKDLVVVALCFGSAPGSNPPYTWNANCDVNNDGKVDGKDLTLVALHFGQADP